MKTIMKVVVLITVIAISSCKNSNDKNTQNEYINNPSHLEDAASNMSDLSDDKTTADDNYTMKNDSLLKIDKEDLSKMYIHLGMKDDQIQNFETIDLKYIQSIKSNEEPIDIEKLWEQRSENLEEILTESQYQQYNMWKRDMDRKDSVKIIQ